MIWRWLAIAVVLPVALGFSTGARAQQTSVVFIDPAERTVPLEGGAFDVRVMVRDVRHPAGLGGYTLVLRYDPAVVRALSVADSGLIASTGNGSICPSSVVDQDAGRVALLCFTIPLFLEDGPRPLDPALLATVTMEPVAPGATAIDLSETVLTDPNGRLVPAALSGGRIAVAAGALPELDGPTSPDAPEAGDPAPSSGAGTGAAAALPASGTGSRGRTTAWPAALVGAGVALVAGGLWIRRELGT